MKSVIKSNADDSFKTIACKLRKKTSGAMKHFIKNIHQYLLISDLSDDVKIAYIDDSSFNDVYVVWFGVKCYLFDYGHMLYIVMNHQLDEQKRIIVRSEKNELS